MWKSSAKRPPVMEILLTIAVMAFLALVIAGSFGPGAEDLAHLTAPPR